MRSAFVEAFEAFEKWAKPRVPPTAFTNHIADEWKIWWDQLLPDDYRARLQTIARSPNTAIEIGSLEAYVKSRFASSSDVDDTWAWVLVQLASREPFAGTACLRQYRWESFQGPRAILLQNRCRGDKRDQFPLRVLFTPRRGEHLALFHNLNPSDTDLQPFDDGFRRLSSVKTQILLCARWPAVFWCSAGVIWKGTTLLAVVGAVLAVFGTVLTNPYMGDAFERYLLSLLASLSLLSALWMWRLFVEIARAKNLHEKFRVCQLIVIASGAKVDDKLRVKGKSFHLALWLAVLLRLSQSDAKGIVAWLIRRIPPSVWDQWAFTGSVTGSLRLDNASRIRDKLKSCEDTGIVRFLATPLSLDDRTTETCEHSGVHSRLRVSQNVAEASSVVRDAVRSMSFATASDVLVQLGTVGWWPHTLGAFVFWLVCVAAILCGGSAALALLPAGGAMLTAAEARGFVTDGGAVQELHVCIDPSWGFISYVVRLQSQTYGNVDVSASSLFENHHCEDVPLGAGPPSNAEAGRSGEIELRLVRPRQFLLRPLPDRVLLHATVGALDRR